MHWYVNMPTGRSYETNFISLDLHSLLAIKKRTKNNFDDKMMNFYKTIHSSTGPVRSFGDCIGLTLVVISNYNS